MNVLLTASLLLADDSKKKFQRMIFESVLTKRVLATIDSGLTARVIASGGAGNLAIFRSSQSTASLSGKER
jgi:hypothetical protein